MLELECVIDGMRHATTFSDVYRPGIKSYLGMTWIALCLLAAHLLGAVWDTGTQSLLESTLIALSYTGLLAMDHGYRFYVSTEGIEARHWFRKRRFARWTQMARASRTSQMGDWLERTIIEDAVGKELLRIGSGTRRLDELLQRVKPHVMRNNRDNPHAWGGTKNRVRGWHV